MNVFNLLTFTLSVGFNRKKQARIYIFIGLINGEVTCPMYNGNWKVALILRIILQTWCIHMLNHYSFWQWNTLWSYCLPDSTYIFIYLLLERDKYPLLSLLSELLQVLLKQNILIYINFECLCSVDNSVTFSGQWGMMSNSSLS